MYYDMYHASPQVQRELRQQQEESDVALRAQQEEAAQVRRDLEAQLEACRREILELHALRAQLEAREEVEEGLLREREELQSRLGVAEHRLAMLKAGGRSEVVEGAAVVEEGRGEEGEDMRELGKLASENETLREE